MTFRELPPMPSQISVWATVRDMGSREIPVAVVRLSDVVGDIRDIHLESTVAFDLAIELLRFCRQVTQP
jgi:hypothetical protein